MLRTDNLLALDLDALEYLLPLFSRVLDPRFQLAIGREKLLGLIAGRSQEFLLGRREQRRVQVSDRGIVCLRKLRIRGK